MNTKLMQRRITPISERLLRPPWPTWIGKGHAAELCRGSVSLQYWPAEKPSLFKTRSGNAFTLGRYETDGTELWVSQKLLLNDVDDAIQVLEHAKERFRQLASD